MTGRSAEARFSAADVQHWEGHGFVVLPGFLRPDELAAPQAELPALYPTADEFHDDVDPERNARFRSGPFSGLLPFPFASVELSLLAVHPAIVSFAEAVLRSNDIRLYHGEAWAKYAGATDYDQSLHVDFQNHTPLVPSADPDFRQLELFVYLDDVPESYGPAHIVSRTHTVGLPLVPAMLAREDHPDVYEREVSAAGPPGTVVAYSPDTWHRATAMTAPRAARFTMNISFRLAEAEWGQRHGWADRAIRPGWRPFVERASLRQLLLFGFPPPGHRFWTEQTLAGMARRYPGLDLTPWRQNL